MPSRASPAHPTPKILGQIPCRGIAVNGALAETLQASPFQLTWQLVVDRSWRSRFVMEDLIAKPGLVRSLEWTPPCEQFIQYHAETVDIGASIHPVTVPASLLGSHVGQSPAKPTGLGQ